MFDTYVAVFLMFAICFLSACWNDLNFELYLKKVCWHERKKGGVNLASFYGVKNQAMSVSNQEEVVLLSEVLPIVKIDFPISQLKIMLHQLPIVLSKAEAYLTVQTDRSHRNNHMKQQFRQSERQLKQLAANVENMEEMLNTNPIKYYDEFAFYLEFIFGKLPIDENGTLLEQISLHKNKVKDLSFFTEKLYELFQTYFQFKLSIQLSNYPTDELGVSADGQIISYFIFTGYDILYNYPTLFKHEDIPSMVYNIASFMQPKSDKGRTKSMITQLAYERVMQGMAMKAKDYHLFSFNFQPHYKFQLSDYALPLLDERQRLMVYYIDQYEMLNNQSESRKEQVGKFLVCRFTNKQSSELDSSHLPIPTFFLQDENELEQLIASIPNYRNYHEVLLQQFYKRKEE